MQWFKSEGENSKMNDHWRRLVTNEKAKTYFLGF